MGGKRTLRVAECVAYPPAKMGMFAQSPSQLLMLLIPIAMTVLMFVFRRNAPRRFVRTGVGAALLGAAVYIFTLFFIEGFGPLFLIGYADTLLLYLPLCVVVSGLLSIGSILLRRTSRDPR
jgi:hypothetical protein